jgi:phage-related minor tail protein
MSTEERRVQLVAEVDTTRTRAGFNEIGQQAGQMAQQVTRAGDQAERAVTGVGAGASTSSQRVDSASRSIVASIQRTTAAMEAGGRQTAAYYELMARQRGVDPSTLRPYLDQLRSVEQAQARTAASAGASAAQITNAMRMVPAQLTDVATQLAGGQSPLLVLLQQGGQLRDQFGSIPATIRGVGSSILGLVSPVAVGVAALGALAYAYSEGSKEADAYTRAIIMSGNAAGASTSQLSAYAAAISKTVGTQAEASQAVAALVSTGQVGAENLKQFGTVAVQVQKYIGRSVEDTVKDFEELGKSPVQASLKLSESYHYLTAATYEQIKALQDQGKSDEAAEVAQKAYSDAFAGRAQAMKDNLGVIEGAWTEAKESAAKAWDVFLGVGRKKTPAQELAEVQEQIKLARMPAGTGAGERGDAAEMMRAKAASKLTELLKRETELQGQVEKDAWDAQQAAASEKLRQAGLEWSKIMDGTLSKAELQRREIAKVTNEGLEAGASDEDIKKAVDRVKQKYFDLNNVTLTQLENNRSLQKEKMVGELADAESQYKRQLISQDEYYAKKRDIQLREIDLEIPILKEQARIADGKEEKSAREKANGELAVLMQKRANIISGAANAIKDADFDRTKTVDALVSGWDRAITAQKEAIAQEIFLFGQSDQARRVYLEQAKIEADVRKQIADLAKAGHALTEQEIADLYRKAAARKLERGDLLNQEATLAAANQLLRDNERFSSQYIADTDLRAQRITAIDAKQWQYLIDHTAEGSEARKKILEQFDVWMANRQMQPVLDRWKGVIDNLDNNFQEGFRDMLTGGQNVWSSFAKSIGNTLKTSLADALYQVFIKKYVVQVVAGLAGVISGPAIAASLAGEPAAGSVASSNSAIGTVQAASGLYSVMSRGFSGLNSTLGSGLSSIGDAVGSSGLSQFGSGLSGSAGAASQTLGAPMTGSASAGASAGSYVSIAASSIGGHYLGNAISGGYGIGDHGQAITNAGTAVGAAIGYYFGGVAGGLLGGAVGGLANRAFGRGSTEVEAQGYQGTLSATSLTGKAYQDLHQDGGWFSSDRDWKEEKDFAASMVKQFTEGLGTIESASAGFASSLGVQSDWIRDYSKVFDLKLTGDATKDQQAITDFFGGIGDEIAKKLVPNLDDLSKSGETASAALERLAGEFKGTDQIAQLLGFSASQLFGEAGLGSAKAREQLIDLAGGLSVLASEASFFNQNFLTDAERIKPVAEALDKALASLGLSTIPTTRDEFKSLVNDLVTSGAAATESGAKQLDSLLALAEAFSQVHPAVDAVADAAAKAAAEAEKAAAALQAVKDAASTMLAGVNDAYSALQKVVSREKSAIQVSVDTHTAAFNKLQSLSQALHSTLDSLKSPDQKAYERAAAQAQIRAALAIAQAGGPLPDSDSLKNALSAVSQDSSKLFGSREDYLFDLLTTQNDVAQLAGLTDDSLSVEQKSLDALNAQLKSLDAIVANGQAQIDALNGQSVATLTLAQAMAGFQSSIGSAQANSVVAGTSTLAGMYQNLLGRAPDQAGLQYWQGILAGGTSLDQIRSFFTNSDEYKKLHSFDVGTNRVPYDMVAQIHADERIIPAADNRVLMSVLARASRPSDNSAVLADAVKGLQEENAKQREVIEGMAKDMAIMADVLKGASPGGSFIRVKGV